MLPKAVPAPKEFVQVYPEFIDLLDGDHLAAMMLSRIYFWHQPDKKGNSRLRVVKNGRNWLVKSNTHWAEELRFTRSQTNRCLSKLRDLGLIKTELHKFQGVPTLHILYTGQMHPHVQPGCTPTCNEVPVDVQPVAHQGATLYTVNTDSENDSDNTQLASEVADTEVPEVPPEFSGGEKVGEVGEVMNAQDILKALKEKQAIQTGSGIKAATLLWKKRTALEGHWVKDLTGKEVGQLKHALTALGEPAIKVLDHALQNWQKFAMAVSVAKGVPPAMNPDCGFFCKYSDVAFLQWKKQGQPVQLVAVSTQPTTKVSPAPTTMGHNATHETLATAEQVQATLATLAAMAAAKS